VIGRVGDREQRRLQAGKVDELSVRAVERVVRAGFGNKLF
jgi:hypothetical protein